MIDDIVLVTGLWDIGRGDLPPNWARSYEYYLECFGKLLESPFKLIIYGDSDLQDFVFKKRSHDNTQFIVRDLNYFKDHFFYNKIKEIRTNPDWHKQASWLSESTQATLDMYNPIVMSKMFLINDAKILNKFDCSHLFWIDAGIASTVSIDYINKLSDMSYFNKFTFICFPYAASNEVHGFKYDRLCDLAGYKTELVCRGGFFGGPVSSIGEVNGIYYQLMESTLNDGYMGTEESLFTILLYRYPHLFNYYEIESNGLLYKFFEDLKNNEVDKKSFAIGINNDLDVNNTALYVLTYNSPSQFKSLLESMEKYDSDFINLPKKFLLNNSTNNETYAEYVSLCNQYGFAHIKKDNIGICGGRQFCAEHAHENNFDFSLFFEDDMQLYQGNNVCKNGFNRITKNLYKKSLDIIKNNNIDYLKLSYTEFYGDNSIQWSWYNVPPSVRSELWPNNKRSNITGADPNAPKTKFESIASYQNVPYALGEVYYCNWPHIFTKMGNKKMFIDTKWDHPYEQTWMSHFYQLMKSGVMSSGLLLMSPIEHDRYDFYPSTERREN